ncbi:hypothetical protein KP509_08G074800 [Ceratopteris richardii]|uniref:BING4 C-terminal domain-containing protein n=1 Tax=Ceratopteris richardii TaxID=49495 RepID=A0A8T2U995_CERRI|nr:hypothetical protein KP509_08G074800 [Ceratopteris richardii]
MLHQSVATLEVHFPTVPLIQFPMDLHDKKLRGKLQYGEKLINQSAKAAAKFEQWLLPSEAGYLEPEGLEQTKNFSQEAIVSNVDISSARKAFDIQLPALGPYTLDFSPSGRYLVFGGRRGHLATIDWKSTHLVSELQVAETTRDVKFLHNELFFAAAQKKYVYIYDKKGTEIHCLKEHTFPLKLEFLPHHFLLVSVDKFGSLRYQDTSTGLMVAQHRTHLGRCSVLRMNPYNAVVGLGHNNGSVTMWSPNMSKPLVTLLCHHGPVTAVAFESQGQQMITAGMDGKVKVFDLRKYVALHAYFSKSPAKSLDISQQGLLAVGEGSNIEIWRDALTSKQYKPYMTHHLPKGWQISNLLFCPYEDTMGIGHSGGLSSILVPGSGEANFDTFVANPFETVKQRQEAEVHLLLDKLQPEMIALDPKQIGSIRREPKEHSQMKSQQALEANRAAAIMAGKLVVVRHKKKGRDKPTKRQKRKQNNIITAKRPLIEAQIHSKSSLKKAKISDQTLPLALRRFA